MTESRTYTAFLRDQQIAGGDLADVLRAIGDAKTRSALVFADDSGDLVKLNTAEDVAEALLSDALVQTGSGSPPKPVSIELRLLPRHLDWLQAQPGGPSAAVRRLVDAARRNDSGRARRRREAAYRFTSMMAGDFPGFEAATRALFAGCRAGFETATADWPAAIRDYGLSLAGDGLA